MEITDDMVRRCAQAMSERKGLFWDLMPEDWQSEIRQQARVGLQAALNPDWERKPTPEGRTERWMERAEPIPRGR